ncbi:hypothetical protein FN846DRAFT_906717 [Sphaerosporella brunnea]|uniref:Uncharacterized protein n=1 Tax=Sphaerosporella brunnea TaxID=1250544 RepID=A0A5J5EY70_9PEZI|nr:hypothetical protein FN846DRAFT_906717 [Sphaerosporella brunnea]
MSETIQGGNSNGEPPGNPMPPHAYLATYDNPNPTPSENICSHCHCLMEESYTQDVLGAVVNARVRSFLARLSECFVCFCLKNLIREEAVKNVVDGSYESHACAWVRAVKIQLMVLWVSTADKPEVARLFVLPAYGSAVIQLNEIRRGLLARWASKVIENEAKRQQLQHAVPRPKRDINALWASMADEEELRLQRAVPAIQPKRDINALWASMADEEELRLQRAVPAIQPKRDINALWASMADEEELRLQRAVPAIQPKRDINALWASMADEEELRLQHAVPAIQPKRDINALWASMADEEELRLQHAVPAIQPKRDINALWASMADEEESRLQRAVPAIQPKRDINALWASMADEEELRLQQLETEKQGYKLQDREMAAPGI